jgi:hypothetical protein
MPPYVFGLLRLHPCQQQLGHLGGQLGDQVGGVVRVHLLQDVCSALDIELRDQLHLLVFGQLLQSVCQLVIIKRGGDFGSTLAGHLVKFPGDVGSLHVLHRGQQLVGALAAVECQDLDRGPVHNGDVAAPAKSPTASRLPQRHLRQLPVIGTNGPHCYVEDD